LKSGLSIYLDPVNQTPVIEIPGAAAALKVER
jgi:hypothetical protein